MRRVLVVLCMVGVALSQQLVLKKPPKSLDRYYPPRSNRMEFLSNMHAMSASFYGIRMNINKGNWERALEWAKNLEKAYNDSAKMVPEWKDYYKSQLASELVKAVQSKNADAVIRASRALGETCSKCHAENQAVVKVYYHFPRYDRIQIEDPVELQNLKTQEFMKKLSDSMKALRVLMAQGDFSGAKEEGKNFVERAKAMNTMCSKCHTSKASIESLAGKDYLSLLDSLDRALSNPQANRDAINKHLSEVGQYCYRCHNVHLTPVLLQRGLEGIKK